MAAYIGLRQQQRSNNFKSALLLLMFPLIILAVTFAAIYLILWFSATDEGNALVMEEAIYEFIYISPFVIGIVGIWFAIAYFSNTAIINASTGARPLDRRENPRVYNIVENLCIGCGMKMPKVYVIDSPELNAYASGINDKTYSVTVTRGLMNTLDDDELSGVIAHELTHIRNRDTRLLIISIVFVGIMSVVMQMAFRLSRNMSYSSNRNSNSNNKGGASNALIMLIIALVAAIGYFFTMLTRFAISRKREFMADAGGAELCHNPLALASALRKISQRPAMEEIEREDVAQLFIYHKGNKEGLISEIYARAFSTHPDIDLRIKYLEQF